MTQNRNSVKIIGLTGGIATGKSTVTKILLNKGCKVIDADKIARDVVEIGKQAYDDIVEKFGKCILNEDLTINRKKLGNIIFKSRKKRELLNKIVHPKVVDEIKRQIQILSGDNNVVFLDIPLLIEELNELSSQGLRVDEIWLVYADEEIQLRRLMERDNLNREEAINRIRSQISIVEKKKYADVIIDNSNGLVELEQCINNLLIKRFEGHMEG